MNLADKNCYQCKTGLLPGHSYAATVKIAWRFFNRIATSTKRRPYVRSAYFNNEKVFLDHFWPHLNQKNPTDRKHRLRYLQSGIELIRNYKCSPVLIKSDIIRKEVLYRFMGIASGTHFLVQVKEDIKHNQKSLMSIFGYNEK